MKKNIFIIAMATVMASACSSSKQVASSADLNGEWTIEKVNGTAINKNAGDEIPFLGFEVDKKNVYGCTGCNNLTGTMEIKDNKLDLSKMGCTQMLCADMTNEQIVLGALEKVNSFSINENGNLILTNKQGKAVIELAKKK